MQQLGLFELAQRSNLTVIPLIVDPVGMVKPKFDAVRTAPSEFAAMLVVATTLSFAVMFCEFVQPAPVPAGWTAFVAAWAAGVSVVEPVIVLPVRQRLPWAVMLDGMLTSSGTFRHCVASSW